MWRCREARSPRRRSREGRSSSRSRPRPRTGPSSASAALGCPTPRADLRATCTQRCACSFPSRWTRRHVSGRQSNPDSQVTRARRLLLPLVFISGMASLGVEFGASRLLAPYFGTSLYVWGVLIGLILIYLSAGYVIGGRLADRHPREGGLFQITAWAGLWIGIIPLVSYPILLLSQQGFKELSVGLVLGTLLAVVVLFAVAVILLRGVGPFAVRPL